MHAGTTDPRELGKASAKARARPNPERVHESLRDYLKREVPPERVWRALELAMEGQNESARVSASRVLMDALHEPEGRDRTKELETAAADARAYLERKLRDRALLAHKAGESELARAYEQAARDLWAPGEKVVTSGGVIVGDVPAREAEATLRELVKVGLIRPPASADDPDLITELRAEVAQLEAQLARIPKAVREEYVLG
jgi:hypothetical protein